MKNNKENTTMIISESSVFEPDDQFSTIGKILKSLRTSHGYKQRAVAKAINVTASAYSHYECSERYPDLATLIKLSNLYQINISFLILTTCVDLAKKNNIHISDVFRAYSYNQILPREDADILMNYYQLSPANKENLQLFLEAARMHS